MNIKNYVSTEIGFAAFVVTVAVSTILGSLAVFSFVGGYANIALASEIPQSVEEIGMFGALLLTVFFVFTEAIGDVS
jgi:hypothetical protein